MKKELLFGIFTVVLILIIGLFSSKTVMSQSQEDRMAKEAWYDSLESQYIDEMRQLLIDNGYENCGINMTKIYDDKGNREYTVTVYHNKFEKTDTETMNYILTSLSEIEFSDELCTFQHELIF